MGAGVDGQQPAVAGKHEQVGRVQAATTSVMDTRPTLAVADAVGLNESRWNTRNLPSRMAVDALSAATAGGLVAPLITMIDK